MTWRLSVVRKVLDRLAEHDPAALRRRLVIDRDGTTLGAALQPWQERDFAALDPAWRRLTRADRAAVPAELASLLPVTPDVAVRRRAWIERPRGHAKTSDVAVQLAWALLYTRHPVDGVVAAADRDQAGLVWDALVRLRDLNANLFRRLKFTKFEVENPTRQSRLQITSSDVSSSWGTLPDFVVCDELCHWTKPELWESLFSSAAKKPDCLLAVLTNAGIGRGWQWEARETARTNPRWYFSSLDGPCAPWIDEAALEEQRAMLPRPVFERLWLNVWQHSDGEFVTLAEAEACRDPSLAVRNRGEPGTRYVAAIDYAEKHDYTVGVVVHQEFRGSFQTTGENVGRLPPPTSSTAGGQARIVVDRMDVQVPGTNRPTPVSWVVQWMRNVARDFHDVAFVVDEYQLVGVIQELESTLEIHRFDFAAGLGNHALATNLRRLIVHRDVRWYSGCGAIDSPHGRDDLETELASLLLRESTSGRVRFDHHRDGRHHDDRAYALGAACLHVVQSRGGSEWLHVTPPSGEGLFRGFG